MSGKKKEVLLIIPAYNEEKSIGAFLDKLEEPEIADIADILVVNDASRDNTANIARERGHLVISHAFNLGYGSGLQVGYKYALRRGYKYVIQMDADGQHDACNVIKIYEALLTADEQGRYTDIVIGSRFMKESVTFPISAFKKLAIDLFRFLIKLGTGRKISDPTSGLQGLSRRTVQFYSEYGHLDDRYPDANMITQMLMLGFRIKEIPAVMHARTEGVSMHFGLRSVNYMFRMMFSIMAVWIRIKLYKVDVGEVNEDRTSQNP